MTAIKLKVLFFLGILTNFRPVMSSAGTFQYDDRGLTGAYRVYRVDPRRETYIYFENYAREYYSQSPLECIKLLNRYQSNCAFVVIFWRALRRAGSIETTKIAPATHYPHVLMSMSACISDFLQNLCCNDETKFKTEIGVVSSMIKAVENIHFELKHAWLGNVLDDFSNRIEIWRFVIRKFSADFKNKTIDYESLFSTFNEIKSVLKTNSSNADASPRLVKLCALLWLYLRRIYITNCMAIFNSSHYHKTFVIFLTMEHLRWPRNFFLNGEFNSSNLGLYLKERSESGLFRLDLIRKLLDKYSITGNCELLKLSYRGKVSSFFGLANLLDERLQKKYPHEIWRIKALAELERCMLRKIKEIYF